MVPQRGGPLHVGSRTSRTAHSQCYSRHPRSEPRPSSQISFNLEKRKTRFIQSLKSISMAGQEPGFRGPFPCAPHRFEDSAAHLRSLQIRAPKTEHPDMETRPACCDLQRPRLRSKSFEGPDRFCIRQPGRSCVLTWKPLQLRPLGTVLTTKG